MSDTKTCEAVVSQKTVDGKVTPALRSELVAVAKEAGAKDWKNVDIDAFKITVISGGITNALYRVKHDGFSVVVRVYGEDTDLVIDRSREEIVNGIMTEAGFGKPTYCLFNGGRVEGWIDGRALEPSEMLQPELQSNIAARLAEMHLVEADGLPKNNSLWTTIDNWLKKAQGVSFDSEARIRIYESLQLDKLEKEIEEVKEQLAAIKTPLVFAHNDLLAYNVIYDESADSGKQINFIDFEYGAYSPRAFDIANHFNECCGFECDWSRFPSRESQNNFFRGYLAQHFDKTPETVSQAEIDSIYHEVNPYVLASHLFWGTWGVVQARYSKIDFDYLSYAQERLVGGFRGQKDTFISLIRSDD